MGGLDKIFATVLDTPLVAYSIEALEAAPSVDQIVLVLSADKVDTGRSLVQRRGWRKVAAVCSGGVRRQDSVRRGLESLTPCDWVVVHDGARPCLEPELVRRGLEAARETGAAVAAVPAKDTIKVVSPTGVVQSTLDRESLWAVQTPQVFLYDMLVSAHRRCEGTVTDDASMLESLGHQVKVYMGSYANLKVTTPEDLSLVEGFLRARSGDQKS